MILTVITFFFTLSLLVLAHEFGHFWVAKKTGIKVEEFGFGYPPRILAKKIGETEYSLNWILFGGFVRLAGEELTEIPNSKFKNQKLFWVKSKKVRIMVILAGVVSNFLLGIGAFALIYSLTGIPVKTNKVKIVGIASGSPAEKFGLRVDDVILAVDEERITDLAHFTNLIQKKVGKEIKLLVERKTDNPCLEKVLGGGGFSCQNGNLVLWITPREKPPEGEGALGVVVSDMEMVKYPFWQMPFLGIKEGIKEAYGWGKVVLDSLGKMIVDLIFQGVIPKDIAGPIGIFQITSHVAKNGILATIQFIGILSINLAVLNILPLPALDGGKLIFIIYELITRRRPKPSLEHWVNMIGMIFLISLIILVTINDLRRIFSFP